MQLTNEQWERVVDLANTCYKQKLVGSSPCPTGSPARALAAAAGRELAHWRACTQLRVAGALTATGWAGRRLAPDAGCGVRARRCR